CVGGGVEPEEEGEGAAVRGRGDVDVEVQAVLAADMPPRLRAHRAKSRGLQHVSARLGRLGAPPAPFADGRRGIRNPAPDQHVSFDHAPHGALLGHDQRRVAGRGAHFLGGARGRVQRPRGAGQRKNRYGRAQQSAGEHNHSPYHRRRTASNGAAWAPRSPPAPKFSSKPASNPALHHHATEWHLTHAMKFRRQLRAFAQAALHILAVVIPAVALARADTAVWRWAFAALTLAGVAQLVLAAFIYIPGFDPLFRIPWRGPRSRRRMAITFDDGPNGAATEVVLELLRRHGAKATFFMIGQHVDAEPELARRVVAEGHAVGSHTWSHVKLSAVPLAVAIDEIDRGHRSLRAAGIADAALFRAPHGHKRPGVVAHLTRNGLRMIAWTAGVYDTDSAS